MLIPIVILLISYLIIPWFFFLWLVQGSSKNKLDWLIKLLVIWFYLIYIFLTGRWDWLSYHLRFVLVVLFLIATFKSYLKTKTLSFNSTRNLKKLLSLGFNSFALLIFAALNIFVLQGYSISDKLVRLSFPLHDGIYYIAQGGNSPLLNHHNVNRTQQYALDIVKLNSFGARATGLYPQRLGNYNIFGETVYSPCDGIIKNTKDGLANLTPPERDSQHPAGNYVLIGCKNVEVLIAHLMNGSVAVSEGESVKQNLPLGKVGNSGNTSEPHLHIHAQKKTTRDSTLDGEGVPIIFDRRFLVRNSLID